MELSTTLTHPFNLRRHGGRRHQRWSMSGLLIACAILLPAGLWADTITLNSGMKVDGVITRIDNGNVSVDVRGDLQTIALDQVQEIDFNTPHVTEGTDSQPLEHFTGDPTEAEMVQLFAKLKKDRDQMQTMLGQMEARWLNRPTVTPDEVSEWKADQERFAVPLTEYQESLREIYLHLLAQVDDYNALAREAHALYVGVKGIFNVGSPLIPGDQSELPMRDYLPRNVVDQIYFEGYKKGADTTRQLRNLQNESPNANPSLVPPDNN